MALNEGREPKMEPVSAWIISPVKAINDRERVLLAMFVGKFG